MADYRENAIEFYADEKTATVSFTQGRYITRIKKLAEKNPDECRIIEENKDGSIVAHIPTKWVKISANKTTRVLTGEEKMAGAERLRRYREEHSTS